MAKKLSEMEKKASMKALMDYRGEAQKLMKAKMHKAKPDDMKGDSSMAKAFKEAEQLLDHDDKDTDLEEFSEEITDDNSTESEDDLDKQIEELMRRKKAIETKAMRG